ncbi:MAG: fibronectin type III domain-containing protein [Lachnospiraceae bacterium]
MRSKIIYLLLLVVGGMFLFSLPGGVMAEEDSVCPKNAEGHYYPPYNITTIEKATCTEPGQRVCTCFYCQEKVYQEIPATGHFFSDSDWQMIKQPTCEEDGYEERKCRNYGCDLYERRPLESLGGHTYIVLIHSDATCTREGRTLLQCEICQKTMYTDITEPLGHDFGDYVVIEATKTTDGSKSRTCKRCGYQELEIIPKFATHVVYTADGILYFTDEEYEKYLEEQQNVIYEDMNLTDSSASTGDSTVSEQPEMNNEEDTSPDETEEEQQPEKAAAPGKPVIASLTRKSKSKMQVKIKKVAYGEGYEVEYAANSKFKKSKKVVSKETSITIKKLEKNKTYYIRVRAYRTVNGKKVYGKYSKVRKIKF